ncbi:L-seryl-tRNA(Sec) selenium transferase [Escherichia coli]|nr:L-seryl-tRNA(Sec) selenium transferase [Escherichia coli]
MPQELIAAGVSLVSFSATIVRRAAGRNIVGKKRDDRPPAKPPLKRALRADKMTLAALEATLRLYLHPEALSENYRPCACLPRSAEVIKSRHKFTGPPCRTLRRGVCGTGYAMSFADWQWFAAG